MERSFKQEVEALRLGAGETFRGEGILAVTKALLQSGVSYVGGYQGAPVSHLLDVMVEAEDLLADLGVHVETCTNEASAAAMLGASINYPLRGAVTWKSIVGTNVAADALSNLASPGVVGGVMLGLGRALGETMAITFVIGNAHKLSWSLFAAGNSIASTLANEFAEADAPLHVSSLFALGLILFVITFIVLAAAKIMLLTMQKREGTK